MTNSQSKLTCALIALCVVRRRRRRKRIRGHWIHPIVLDRPITGKFVLFHNKLKQYPEKFFDYYRMSVASFDYLVSIIKGGLEKTNTLMRDSVSVEEKLVVTLR